MRIFFWGGEDFGGSVGKNPKKTVLLFRSKLILLDKIG
jgi:hypothetical protein